VILHNKFSEVQKYVSVTKPIYNLLQLLMSKKTWDKISPDERKVIQDAAKESRAFQGTEARNQDASAVEALKAAGVQVDDITPQERSRLREKAKPVTDKYSKEVGDEFMEEANAGIAKIRDGK
jgi:TRAP-type C4-dicarboxylate transport system substrate-binding protein